MSKPDFTGTWDLNVAKSSLQIPAPDSTTFVVEHREPQFRLTRTHTFNGKNDTFSIDLTTDGKDVFRVHGGMHVRANLRWDGDTLLFDSTLEQGEERMTNIVRYSLSNDGASFIADEQLRAPYGSHDNRWVFDRRR